jgi:hypothetical protein
MDNLDPVTQKIMADAMGDRSGLTPEQRVERKIQDALAEIAAAKDKIRPTISELYDLIAAGKAAYGVPQDDEHSAKTWFVSLLDHALFAAYCKGRTVGAENVADTLQSEVRAKLAKYADLGDGVPLPLVRTGPGGDFTQEYHG